MKITVITPTKGDRTRELDRLCAKLSDLLQPGDQHIIVWDAHLAHPPGGKYELNLIRPSKNSVSGNIQRDYGAMYAKGDCLVYCDDDDILTVEGIDILHAQPPGAQIAHGFKMVDRDTTYHDIVAGPQIVPPNTDDIPKWSEDNRYEGDRTFVKKCTERFLTMYHPEVLCIVRPV